MGAGPQQVQSGLGGGVAPAHHRHPPAVVRVAVVEVVAALGEILAGDAEAARRVEEPGGHHQGLAMRAALGAAVFHGEGKAGPVAAHRADRAPGAHRQRVVLGDGAVVGHGLAPARLLVGASERQAADGQLLRGGEEGHISGEVVYAVHHRTLLEDDVIQSDAGSGDGAGQSGGTGANDDQLARIHGA